MIPTLAANDPDPARRRAQLFASREAYRFAHLFPSPALPEGVGVAAELPPAEGFPLDVIQSVMRAEARLLANQAASDFGVVLEGLTSPPKIKDVHSLLRLPMNHRQMFAAPLHAARRVSMAFPADVSAYKRQFSLIAKPEIIGLLDKGQLTQDKAFAYERLAGAGPVHLRGITHRPRKRLIAREASMVNGYPAPASRGELPESFALDDEIYARAMGPDDSLDSAIAEGRLFITDYRMLDGIPNGTWGGHRPKYGYAPIAAFAYRKPTRECLGDFMPVAIQCHQHHGGTSENPVFTPRDGVRWKMARTVVQSADGQAQELIYHLGRTHLVMEAATVSAHRSLATSHPLMVLLAPHLACTLTINDHAVHALIAPGGQIEEVFAKTLAGSLEVTTRSLAELDFTHLAPVSDVAHRLVGNRDGLPDYPWRDDALELWPALERFVHRYCALYYASAADVVGDVELRSFVSSMGSPDEGNLRGVVQPTDLASLARFIATLIWTASAQHSCLNYAQFPMMGYVVNVPGSLYAEAPTATTPQDEARWMAMLPPGRPAAVQFATLYELSQVRTVSLGNYPMLQFLDQRVKPILADYREELVRVETMVVGNDALRLLSYPYLRPSQIGQSIFI